MHQHQPKQYRKCSSLECQNEMINPPQHKVKCKILSLQHTLKRSILQSVKTSIKHLPLTQVILGSNTTVQYRSYTSKYKSHEQLTS